MNLKGLLTLAVFVALAVPQPALEAQDRQALEEVLAGMDGASRTFTDMDADIERETVTVFINHRSTESGRMYFVRDGDRSRIRVSLREPASREFLVDDGKVRIYNPAVNVVEEIPLGEHEDKVEFMVVGFGTSREDLLRYYEVALAGDETLNGVPTRVLDLTPKDPDVARHFTSIRLWMDPERWIPVQTRATQLSRDYLVVRFRNVRTNLGVPDSAFDLDLPDDVEVLRP